MIAYVAIIYLTIGLVIGYRMFSWAREHDPRPDDFFVCLVCTPLIWPLALFLMVWFRHKRSLHADSRSKSDTVKDLTERVKGRISESIDLNQDVAHLQAELTRVRRELLMKTYPEVATMPLLAQQTLANKLNSLETACQRLLALAYSNRDSLARASTCADDPVCTDTSHPSFCLALTSSCSICRQAIRDIDNCLNNIPTDILTDCNNSKH